MCEISRSVLEQPACPPAASLGARGALRRLGLELRGLRDALPAGTFARYLLCCVRSAPGIYAARKLAPADPLMKGKVRVTYHGAQIAINLAEVDAFLPGDTPTFANIREMYGRDVYLRFFDLSRIPMLNVIDAGGNRGLFTIYAAKRAQKVIWVEMQPQYLGALNALISSNTPNARIVPLEGILVGRSDALPAFWRKTMRQERGLADGAYTLENLMETHHLDPISFLKMDIEGAEFSVFAPPCRWIQGLQNLAMEVHRQAGDPAEIVSRLATSGFQVMTADAQLRQCPVERASYIYASRTGALSGRPLH
ncbi:MAG: FkbM family methyltransferase [Terriglobia bacterium]